MTAETDTFSEARVPDQIARDVILPHAYTDEEAHSYPAFKWLRKNNPFGVGHVEGYDPMWFATNRKDILEIELNPEVFASGLDEPGINDKASSAFLQFMRGDNRTLDTLAYMDAPDHTKIKAVTNEWFMPATIRKREETIRALAKRSVDNLLSFDGECDFVNDFALHYPLRVIMTLLGVPPEDEPLMLKLTQEMFGAADPEEQRADVVLSQDAQARMWRAAIEGFFDYFNVLSEDRRKNPRDDLASLVANATVDGKPLPDSYVNGYYVAVAAAGHDTTSSTISGAMHAFAKFPDQLDKVRENPALIPSVVEEALRYVSPVKHFQRVVTRDFVFRDRELHAGDHVMLLYASANRDEAVFENPDQFDVTRRPNKHLAFGYGTHMCIGQHVAKLEMRILLEELLPKIKSIEVTGKPKYVEANFITGLKSLPVKIHKA